MNYIEALIRHKKQWNNKEGKEYSFPYDLRYDNDNFIEVSVPVSRCKIQRTDKERNARYANDLMKGINLGPSWVTFGKRLKNGTVSPFWHGLFYTVDGNHRMEAAILINKTKVDVIVPKSDYDQYVRQYNE